MKEANALIGRKNPSYTGRYKNITDNEAKQILKDTEDHIFQRNIEYDEFGEPIKPDKFQYGGIAPLIGEPSYAANFYDDRTPYDKGKKVKKKKKKKKKSFAPDEDDIFQVPPYETDNPKEAVKETIRRILGSGVMGVPIGGGFEYGTGYGEDRPFDYGIGYNVDPGLGGLYADYGIRRGDENVFSGGYKGDNWDIGMTKEEGSDPTFGFNWKKKFDQGGRARMAGGGVLKKFI